MPAAAEERLVPVHRGQGHEGMLADMQIKLGTGIQPGPANVLQLHAIVMESDLEGNDWLSNCTV